MIITYRSLEIPFVFNTYSSWENACSELAWKKKQICMGLWEECVLGLLMCVSPVEKGLLGADGSGLVFGKEEKAPVSMVLQKEYIKADKNT